MQTTTTTTTKIDLEPAERFPARYDFAGKYRGQARSVYYTHGESTATLYVERVYNDGSTTSGSMPDTVPLGTLPKPVLDALHLEVVRIAGFESKRARVQALDALHA